MSGQSFIDDFTEGPNTLFGDLQDYVGRIRGTLRSGLDTLGIDSDWLSMEPLDAGLDDDDDVWVFQYVTAYSKSGLADGYSFSGEGGSVREGSPSPEVQFKTGIYVVDEPEPDLEKRLKNVDNGRLRTVFDTEVYQDYMSGFGFQSKKTYIQREKVSAREVNQKGYGLGVLWWEVEAYDEDGNLSGYADGYANPYTSEDKTVKMEEAPDQEVWKFAGRQSHESGDRYQISPPGRTAAKERARNAAGKTAVINGFEVGSVLSGGRIRLKVEYSNPSRATYASRKQIIEQSATPYQALSEGANLYKVKETDDRLVFSTTKPEDFDAADPEMMPPEAVAEQAQEVEVTELLMDESEPTQFYIETDRQEKRLMGLYDPPRVREIEEGTEFVNL